jgi:hypothetical protein
LDVTKTASEALTSAFVWLRDQRALKLAALFFIIDFAVFALVSLTMPTDSAGKVLPTAFTATVVALLVVYSLAQGLANSFVQLRALKHFLSAKRLSVIQADAKNAVKLFVTWLAALFSAIIPWLEPRLLIVPAVALLLAAAGMTTGNEAIGVLAMIATFAYVAVMAYGFVRLAFSAFGVAVEKKDVLDALRFSWKFTEGRWLDALLLLAVPGIVVGIVASVLAFAGQPLIGFDASNNFPIPIASGIWQSIVGAFSGMAFVAYTSSVFAALRAQRKN